MDNGVMVSEEIFKLINSFSQYKNCVQFKEDKEDKEDKEEIRVRRRRNPCNDEINCHKPPACYTQCNVPNFGFRNGWSGPDYWPFAKGCPYNEAFSR